MKPPVVFIAGPIRADNAWDREQNIRRAEAVALQVWRRGCAVICVHAAGRFYDEEEARKGGWLDADHELVRRSDAVLVVEGWQHSQGTQAEIEVAYKACLPIFYDLKALEAWLATPDRPNDTHCERFERAGGGASCERCGSALIDHPLGGPGGWPEGRPFLHRLCDGSLVKL